MDARNSYGDSLCNLVRLPFWNILFGRERKPSPWRINHNCGLNRRCAGDSCCIFFRVSTEKIKVVADINSPLDLFIGGCFAMESTLLIELAIHGAKPIGLSRNIPAHQVALRFRLPDRKLNLRTSNKQGFRNPCDAAGVGISQIGYIATKRNFSNM